MRVSRNRRFVDLSVTLDNHPFTDPPPLLPKIDYMDHRQSSPEMAVIRPGLSREQMPAQATCSDSRYIGYGQMAKLANLETLPVSGFVVSCFPHKIKHASAKSIRAVAIFED
jgi:hypothetical protein